MKKRKYRNSLALYRRRIRLSQREVVTLLGHRNVQLLSCYENGHCQPSLKTALTFAAIYCVPVEFLFHNDFASIQNRVRAMKSPDVCGSNSQKEASCRKF